MLRRAWPPAFPKLARLSLCGDHPALPSQPESARMPPAFCPIDAALGAIALHQPLRNVPFLRRFAHREVIHRLLLSCLDHLTFLKYHSFRRTVLLFAIPHSFNLQTSSFLYFNRLYPYPQATKKPGSMSRAFALV